MRPTSSCTVGEKKKTPTGTPLQGQYDATHWQCDLPHPDGMQLSMFLSDLMDRLTVMRSSFIQLGTAGGSVELSIGWYSGSNSGDVFDSHLIAQLASLRMGLSLDVYAEADQAENDEISEATE